MGFSWFFFSSRRRHTRCALVTGVQTCALPIFGAHRGAMPLWTFLRPTPLTRAGRQVRSLAANLGRDFASDIERAHALSALILDRLPWRAGITDADTTVERSEEHTSELQSLMRISYAVFCLKKKKTLK